MAEKRENKLFKIWVNNLRYISHFANIKCTILIFSSGKKGAPREYYTLECLLYLLKNVMLQHSVYVRQCAVSKTNYYILILI